MSQMFIDLQNAADQIKQFHKLPLLNKTIDLIIEEIRNIEPGKRLMDNYGQVSYCYNCNNPLAKPYAYAYFERILLQAAYPGGFTLNIKQGFKGSNETIKLRTKKGK